VTLNPPNKTMKMVWGEGDFFVIIGEDNPDP
jgi:hypothetical protein